MSNGEPDIAPLERVDMEAKLKHLEFIQGVINRLADNSFRIKRWAVILVAALLFLLAREGRVEFAWIGLAPVLVFWGLDGYFLQKEQQYRDLYAHVRTLHPSKIDFSMDVNAFQRTWLGAALSRTLRLLYLMLAAVLVFSAWAVAFINQP